MISTRAFIAPIRTLGSQLSHAKKYPFHAALSSTANPKETMYIIDGTGLLFKSFHSMEFRNKFKNVEYSSTLIAKINDAFPNQTVAEPVDSNKKEKVPARTDSACGALMVMAHQFVRFVNTMKPKHLAVVFDVGRKTFRNDMFPDYKSHRPTVN